MYVGGFILLGFWYTAAVYIASLGIIGEVGVITVFYQNVCKCDDV